MEIVLEFLSVKAVPEHYHLIKELNILFESQGYTNHEEALTELEYDIGAIDDIIVVDKILAIYKQHLIKLLLKMFIVVYEEISIYQLKDILETMILIEKSIESELILSLYKEENTPTVQLIEWIIALAEDKTLLFEDYVIEVNESLIENIVDLHELRVPLEPEELDPKIPLHLSFIKSLLNSEIVKPTLVKDYITKYGFKSFTTNETLSALFGTTLRANPVTPTSVKKIAMETLGLCLLLDCKDDLSSTCRNFIEINFPNPLAQSDIQSEVGKLIAEYNIKC